MGSNRSAAHPLANRFTVTDEFTYLFAVGAPPPPPLALVGALLVLFRSLSFPTFSARGATANTTERGTSNAGFLSGVCFGV
jgi:hypothetical protein